MNESDPTLDGASAHELAGAQIGRYKLLEQIGEGGMGTIWMAEQREPVKRRVALKIIKLGMDTKQVIARFEAERQALALMDHPHIAKVLDAGATETGRPYFVMEYIRGVPILEYCDTEKIDTRARLELFTSVCHAIQHAHQKGIIHRDIKPSNVLVTLHDGVPVPKVIDFGIAKATNSELTTKTLFTEHRQMIGTPAYMSPEQAEMSGLDIDTRSDIYALGVLLYELLTGTTPFDTKALLESGYAEMLRAIRDDEPHKPSTRVSTLGDTGTRTALQRKVDTKKLSSLLRGDVDWIVMKCLEKDRTRRYETANGLAADIGRHLRDEPVTAGAPSAVYKLRKFARRNRVKVLAASAVLAALLVATFGTAWGLVEKSRARSAEIQRRLEDEQRANAEHARLTRNAHAVDALLAQCEEALRDGDTPKAALALDAARRRSAEGGAERDAARLTQLDADLVLARELDAIDQFLWTWTANGFGDPKVAAERIGAALRRFGTDPRAASVDEAAAHAEASAIRARIVGALDWLLPLDDAEGWRALLGRLDVDSYRDAFRDAVVADDAALVESLVANSAALEQPPEFAAALGQNKRIPVERRRELLKMAVTRRPADIVLLMALQGSYSTAKESLDERVRWLQAAITADPRNSAAYTNLGLALRGKGRVEDALACYRAAIALNPDNAPACNNYGALLLDEGRAAEALPWLEKAVAVASPRVDARTNVGQALEKLGRTSEALACFRKAVEVAPEDAPARAWLGHALKNEGKRDEALASYRKAVELDPRCASHMGELGDLLYDRGESEAAIACYRKTVELDAKNPYQHSRLGDALRRTKQLDAAIACYHRAIELDPKYDAYGGLGIALKNKGQSVEAVSALRKSLGIRTDYSPGMQALSGALCDVGEVVEGLAWAEKAVRLTPEMSEAQLTLGRALHLNGRDDDAVECYRAAIALDPQNGVAHHNLGATHVNRGEWEQALPAYRRAIEFAPENAQFQLDLALTLEHLGEHTEARERFEKATLLDPKLAVAHYNVGVYQQEQKRWDAAIESYRKTIELDANYAEAHCNFASCLQNKGVFAEALASFRRGHALGSKRADWSYPSAQWVRDAEMRVALEARLPALVAGEIEPRDDAERLEFAIMCQIRELHVTSAKLFAELLAADPALAERRGFLFDSGFSPALASIGRAKDGAQLDDRERVRLRQQALDWFRADLARDAQRLATGAPEARAAVRTVLRARMNDPELACFREPAALALLPADARDAFAQWWADVNALLNEAERATERPR